MITRHPAAWATLGDGSRVLLRPVHPDDKRLLVEGFGRMSPRARFQRFLAPVEALTPRQVAYLSEVDHHDHVAWGILDGEEPVAVARIVRFKDAPTEADVAISVIDAYQRRGIGRLLIEVLAAAARARGIGVFHFDVLGENRAMLGLVDALRGLRVAEGEVVHAIVPVAVIPPPGGVEGDLTMLLEQARRITV
jgi:GNAT superfamily N-acetyltransferase